MPASRPILVTALRTLVVGGAALAAACIVALKYEVTPRHRTATRPPFSLVPASSEPATTARAAILRSFWYRETTIHQPKSGWGPLAIDVVIEDAQPGFDVHDVKLANVYARQPYDSFPDVRYLDAHGNPADAMVTTAGGKSVAFRLIYLAPATLRWIRLDYMGAELASATIEEDSLPAEADISLTY
jgi:hypothetical protein